MELPTDKEIRELNAEYSKRTSQELDSFKEKANKAIRNGYYNGVSFVEIYIDSYNQGTILQGIQWLENNGYKSSRVTSSKDKRAPNDILRITLKRIPNG